MAPAPAASVPQHSPRSIPQIPEAHWQSTPQLWPAAVPPCTGQVFEQTPLTQFWYDTGHWQVTSGQSVSTEHSEPLEQDAKAKADSKNKPRIAVRNHKLLASRNARSAGPCAGGVAIPS